LPEAPPIVHAEVYCPQCCKRQPVTTDNGTYRCTLCKGTVEPPVDPEACPRSKDGHHNPINTPEGWRCSRCNAVVDEPADAGIMYLGDVNDDYHARPLVRLPA
jgi:hypothetical protein